MKLRVQQYFLLPKRGREKKKNSPLPPVNFSKIFEAI